MGSEISRLSRRSNEIFLLMMYDESDQRSVGGRLSQVTKVVLENLANRASMTLGLWKVRADLRGEPNNAQQSLLRRRGGVC